MLFAIILEYQGTTSVSQVSAFGYAAAFRKWARRVADPQPHPYSLTDQQAVALAAQVDADDQGLVQLQGLTNAWCTTFSTGRGLRNIALINVIATIPRPVDGKRNFTAISA